MINSPADVPAFARDLCVPVSFFVGLALIVAVWRRAPLLFKFSARQSAEMQRQIIAELDQWAAKHPESESSEDEDSE